MRRRTMCVALAVFLASASSSPTMGRQAPAGRQGGAPGGRQGNPPPVQPPEGPGREQVQAACTRCHGFNLVANSWGYTKNGWQDRIATMVKLPAAELEPISSYLATHYPIKDVPGAVLLSGPATVTIKEWMAPTLGSRPHDSHAAADGSIWWTGQFADKLGRLDPRTGQIREFAVPAKSQPHGLAEDAQGNIWYTGIQKGVIGRLDPKSGQVREYPIMEPGVRGPHTPILDKKIGIMFFTLQSGHVGRINLASGEMVIRKTPSDNTYPYGIRLNSQGVPWYVDFRGNRIGSVDPKTMEIKEYTLPNADARPRRLAITPDDVIWYRTSRAARWGASIRRRGRRRNTRRRAAGSPNRTRSPRSATSSGTASPASGRTRWRASIRRRRRSRRSRFPRAAACCVTSRRRPRATSSPRTAV